MKKECEICKKEIIKIPKISKKQWENKKYCSWECRAIGVGQSQIGENNPRHKKYYPAWNKGKFWSEETKKKMSLAHMGMESPLRGRKRLDIPWNKGKYELHKCKGCEEMVRKWEKYCNWKCLLGDPNRKVWNKGTIGIKIGLRGDKAPNWKGGITSVNKLIRQSLKYRLWRKSVFERDDYTCQICDIRGTILHPNHIKKFSDYPNLRFESLNGITLCKNCHVGLVNHHEQEWESYFNFNLIVRGFLPDEYRIKNIFNNRGLD